MFSNNVVLSCAEVEDGGAVDLDCYCCWIGIWFGGGVVARVCEVDVSLVLASVNCCNSLLYRC